MTEWNVGELDWKKMDGLVPAVVQDGATGQVLMVGYMNREALDLTREKGKVHFYSRSREKMWMKGETSGNTLEVVEVASDCDGDALLVRAHPQGPTCHRDTVSCFGEGGRTGGAGWLAYLAQVIDRRAQDSPDESYTASLLERGVERMAQKVGEEGVEAAISAVADRENFLDEASDLLYHLLVLLKGKGKTLEEVVDVLRKRHEK